MKKIIVMLGTPLSGKKTHSKLLSEKLGYKYFSLNEVVAEEVKNKTKIGLILEKYSNTTTKAPDEYAIMLMKEYIINLKENGAVFYNFPQSVVQAKALDIFLFSRKNNKAIAIYLNTNPSVAIKRMSEENKKSFRDIMSEYDKKGRLISDYYAANRLEFDTANSIDVVSEQIIKKI